MSNPIDPPVDTSIFEYPPSFPNGQVNDAWIAYFESLNSAIVGGPVLSFNGRTGAVVPVSGDYSASQISGLAAFIAANGVSSFNGRLGPVVAASGDYPASLIPFTQAGTGAVASTVDVKLKQSVSVVDFGADPIGAADSTAAFNSALATGKSVYVPSGTYALTSIAVPTGQSFDLHGDGKASVLNFNTSGVGIQLTQTIPSFPTIKGSIRGLAFSQVTNVPAAFIRNTGYLNLLIEECYFNNTAATYCIDNYYGYGLTINKCAFTGITGSGVRLRDDGAVTYYSYVASILYSDFSTLSGDGIDVEGAKCLNIIGCAIEGCGGYGIYTNSNGGSGIVQSWGVNIECCDFEVNTLADIKLGTDGSSYWGVATIKNCGFSATPLIDLGAKSKVFIESTFCSGGSSCTISGSSLAEAILVNCSNFVQSGTFNYTNLGAGVLSLPSGSATTPSFNVGDTGTGFYRIGTDKMGVAAGGAKIGDFSTGGWDITTPINIFSGASQFGSAMTSTIFQWGSQAPGLTGASFGIGAIATSRGSYINTTSAGAINFKVGTTNIQAGNFDATGRFVFFVPVAATASANFPVGVTVTSPAAGDVWNDANGTLNFKGNLFATGYEGKSTGTAVSSASTITPTGQIFHITGTTTVTTINLPYTGFTGTIHIIPDAATPFGSSGNIATATVCTVGKTMSFTYDGTKWYPSY